MRNIKDIVEEQVARWRAESLQGRARETVDAPPPCAVVMSHAIASYGMAIATQVGALLGIPVYDREILEHISRSAKVQLATVETLDERARNRVDEYMASVFREKNYDRDDHMRNLGRAVAALWQHGSCVMVGHGCVHLVPRTHALAVRTTAPFEERVRRLMLVADIDLAEARERVRRTDAERAAFHRRFFNVDVETSLLYDVVLDTRYLDITGSAEVIALAYRQRFGARAL